MEKEDTVAETAPSEKDSIEGSSMQVQVPIEFVLGECAEGTIIYEVYQEVKDNQENSDASIDENVDEDNAPTCFIINATGDENNEETDKEIIDVVDDITDQAEATLVEKIALLCSVCNEAFDEINDLKTHERLTHTLDQFESVEKSGCPICQCQVKQKRALNMLKPFLCGICDKGYTSIRELKKHFFIHVKPETYFCDICSMFFTHNEELQKHIKEAHKSEKVNFCPICKKPFRTLSNVKSHMRVHSSERPYACQYCDKAFKSQSELRSHNLIHTNEKPFKCNDCGKSFRQSGNFHSHVRIHKNERPYVCEICNRAFIESGKLKRHIRIHTMEKPYSCEICGKQFCDSSNKKAHEKTHSKENNNITSNKVIYVMLVKDEEGNVQQVETGPFAESVGSKNSQHKLDEKMDEEILPHHNDDDDGNID